MEWYARLLKDSRKSAKEAEAAFLAHWGDKADTAPREHINPQKRDYTGIVNSKHRIVWLLVKSGAVSDAEIASAMSMGASTLRKIKQVLKLTE